MPRQDVQELAGQLRRLLMEPELLTNLRAGIEPVKSVSMMVVEYEARSDALIQ